MKSADESDTKASDEDDTEDRSEDEQEGVGSKRKRTKNDNRGGRIKKGESFWDRVDKLYAAALKEHGEMVITSNQTVYKPSGEKWRR